MYTIIELQTNNGSTSHLVSHEKELSRAQQKFYTILAAASVSDIEIHAALLLNEEGWTIKREFFNRSLQNNE